MSASLQVPTYNEILCLASDLNLTYPPSFLAFIESAERKQLDSIYLAFPNGRFLKNLPEIQLLHEVLGKGLLPFFIEGAPRTIPSLPDEFELPAHWNVYCFGLNRQSFEWPVVVFSVHAVVKDWQNFQNWIEWVELFSRSRSELESGG